MTPRRALPTTTADVASRMSEAQLLAHVRDAATKLGWLCYHTHNSKHSEAGFPDVVLVRKRTILFVELKGYDSKRRMGVVSGEQMQWLTGLTEARKRGDHVLIWRPEQWTDGSIERCLLAERGPPRERAVLT